MGLLDTYRINKALAVLLTSQDAASAETMQAVATLKRLGQSAIPKLIEALGKVRTPHTMVALLTTLVQNATLPLFGDGLASTSPRVVAGVVEVLTQATTYDPNRLLDFFTDPRIAKATLGKLLTARKEMLQPALLLRCLDTVRAEHRPLLLGLVRQVATVESVPALIRRTTSTDETVRLAMARTLARFRTEEVRDAFMSLLTDVHGPIREAALEGLARLPFSLHVGPICQLLRDPETSVRRQASVLLTQQKDPQMVPYLFEVLQDPSPEVQQGAVELLSVVGDTSSIKAAVTSQADTPAMRDTLMRLLAVPQTRVRQLALEGLTSLQAPVDFEALCRLLWDPDRIVRQQATMLLSQLNTPQTLPVLIETLQAEAPDVRQGAVAILNTIGDVSLLKNLLSALVDQEWWVTMRVTDALGRGGGAKVIDAALKLSLDPDASLRRGAIEILKLTQDPQVLNFLVAALDTQDSWLQTCAAEVAGALGEKRVVPALLHLAQTGDTDMRLVALRTLTSLGDARAVPILLTHLQQGPSVLQREALQALATLTDAEHSEAVLQAVMAVRSNSDADLKALANGTASAIIRRFGARAVGRRTTADVSMSRPAPQSLLYESTPNSSLQSAMASTPGPESSGPDPTPDSPVAEAILDASALAPGMMLAERYRVVRQIGQGGFGTVVLVEDTMVHEQLILKFLNPHMAADARMIKRFIRELRYARRVTHENVIRIHDFLRIEKAYAISMEYFPSHSLNAEMPRHTPMPPQRALRILWYICRGMHAAHQVKIIHRDLKPPNVLISDAGVVKIVDFGLAAAVSDTATRLTRTGALLGTPLYMAPEQVQNRKIDVRTDIYSLGIMMYEMCTGRPPYCGNNPMAILYQHLEGKATPPRALNAALPPELEAIILQAMAVDPAQRFQSMEAFGKSLIPLLKQSAR
jgi:eukaryotic-like serine/threonine-protein kinase